jgi:hypothetical protein
MQKETKTTDAKNEQKYVKPETKKHEPVKIVQGSGGCSGLYYTSLYTF